MSINVLRTLFPGHIISQYGDVAWPERSLDLSACDFWLWGYLKSKIYARKPQSRRDLKNIIINKISAIPMSMTQCVCELSKKIGRLCGYRDIGEGHLSDIIIHPVCMIAEVIR